LSRQKYSPAGSEAPSITVLMTRASEPGPEQQDHKGGLEVDSYRSHNLYHC